MAMFCIMVSGSLWSCAALLRAIMQLAIALFLFASSCALSIGLTVPSGLQMFIGLYWYSFGTRSLLASIKHTRWAVANWLPSKYIEMSLQLSICATAVVGLMFLFSSILLMIYLLITWVFCCSGLGAGFPSLRSSSSRVLSSIWPPCFEYMMAL